ncbi:MAG: beta-lactamase family protein [Bacteroidetes bacterium]|nr:beta-lactamase family protein [Bacteroidota bacterium]MBU1114931.1 beta-lactamase family protein [Bacteroidota bacterium]MBU1798686.1 beta-lactamase family protein [Bacteroidota bacterium]
MYKIVFPILLSIVIFSLVFSNEEKEEKIIPPKFIYNEIYSYNNLTTEKIDSFFLNRYKMGAFSGTVLFSKHDTIVYKKAFGFANTRKKDSLKIDSRFQLASVSKTFTAFGIMLLEKEGKLSFQDSVRKFFPDFPYENISIHQLLVHRSGLPNYMYVADEFWHTDKNITIDNCDIIDLLIAHEPLKYRTPGTKYNYNNTNYALLASIIEKVTAMKFTEFMEKNVFDALGMINTTIYDKNDSAENKEKVIGYVGRNRIADNTYLNGVVGDKGVYSTVEDMNKFSRAIFENYLFSKDEMNSAYQLYNKELHDHDNYGYGWRINMLPDSTKIVYHSGWWKGFRSYFIRSLKDEKTIIVLSNNSRTGKFNSKELMDLFDIKYELLNTNESISYQEN